jgi:hypothetical protein
MLAQNGDPRDPGVAARLASLGVGVVTVHPFAYERLGLQAPDPTAPPPGFRVLAAFPDGSAVWRVTAAPADGVALPTGSGWWPAEYGDDGMYRWMTQQGTVSVVVRTAGVHRIELTANGLRGAQNTLRLEGPGVVTPNAATVGQPTRVVFTADLPAGRTDLTLVSDRPAEVIGDPDLRAVTVGVRGLTVRSTGGG